MLRKLNYTLGIIALIGALICGGFWFYQSKVAKVNETAISDLVEEALR